MKRYVHGFIAGFLATLVFHQPVVWLIRHTAYSMNPTKPFGVPSVISLAFWGGIWGIILVMVMPTSKKGAAYWIAALAFGAVAPTLVAWFVAAPLKGQPMAGGFKPAAMLTGLAVNGAWGLGTALFLRAFR